LTSGNIISFLLLTMLFIAWPYDGASAATDQDILALMRQPFEVNGQVEYIKSDYIIRTERFFNSHRFTPEQYDQILARVNEAREILKMERTTDPTSMTWQSEHRLLRLIYEGGEIVNVTIKYGKTDVGHGYLAFYEKDGRKIDEIYYAENSFKITGTNYGIILIGGFIMALIGIVLGIYRRRLLALLN